MFIELHSNWSRGKRHPCSNRKSSSRKKLNLLKIPHKSVKNFNVFQCVYTYVRISHGIMALHQLPCFRASVFKCVPCSLLRLEGSLM